MNRLTIKCVDNDEAIVQHVQKMFKNVMEIKIVSDEPSWFSTLEIKRTLVGNGAGSSTDTRAIVVFVHHPHILGWLEIHTFQKLMKQKGFIRTIDLQAIDDNDERPKKKQKAMPRIQSIAAMEHIREQFSGNEEYDSYFQSPFVHGTGPIELPMIGPALFKTAFQCHHLWFHVDKTKRFVHECHHMDLKKCSIHECEQLKDATYALWQRLTKETIKRQI